MGSSTFSSDVNPTRPDDLYNIQNKFPTTSNRIPQQPNREQEATPTPNRSPPSPPPPPPTDNKRPPSPFHFQKPSHHHYESDTPDVHHPYPLGPDPFPDYFPQPHPPYHFHHLDHFDEKSSHSPHFPGIYAQHAPSLHHPDRYYSHHQIDQQHYSVYPLGGGHYPDNNNVAYNPNRKNGYQVTEQQAADKPMGKRE
jgi:hypothetical protein